MVKFKKRVDKRISATEGKETARDVKGVCMHLKEGLAAAISADVSVCVCPIVYDLSACTLDRTDDCLAMLKLHE